MEFLMFFIIVLTIYFLANIFIYRKGIHALSGYPKFKKYIRVIFWILVLAFPAGKIIEQYYLSQFTDILIWTGSVWLAALLYFFLISLVVAVLRLIQSFWHFMPKIFFSNRFKRTVFLVSIIAVGVILTTGYFNANQPVVKHKDIEIPKQSGNKQSIHAVMVSDIHLGTLIDNDHLQKIVKKINTLEPDIIFMPGDLVDSDLEPVLKNKSGKAFQNLNAESGIYATTGNHEFIGGVQDATEYLEKFNIRFLRDTTLFVNDNFYLIGREDREKNRFEDKERKPLNQLTAMVDTTYPVILMDHQPFHPEEAADAGIDLQLSGHTHNGQLWPINYITSALFEISNGFGKIGNMQIYVSSGVGTWGPPIRIGSQAEIISLNIHFKDNKDKKISFP